MNLESQFPSRTPLVLLFGNCYYAGESTPHFRISQAHRTMRLFLFLQLRSQETALMTLVPPGQPIFTSGLKTTVCPKSGREKGPNSNGAPWYV